MARERWLIDCDTGYDDAVALLMALRAPEIEVAGITVVNGNVPVDIGLANTLRVVELAEAPPSVPVARGADRPLVEPRQHATHVHGEEGLCGYPLPEPARPVDPRPAAQFLVETIMASPTPVTLVLLAPLTNVALALRLEPRIVERIGRVVLMGGSADGTGNHTPAAEFNIAVDPEAAWIVFHSGLPITMVGLDPCRPTAVPVERRLAWQDSPSPRLRFLAGILDYLARELGRPAVAIYDAVALSVALRPEIAKMRRLPATVELAPGHHRGAVLVDRRTWRPTRPDWPEIDVVFAVDCAEHERLMLDRLR